MITNITRKCFSFQSLLAIAILSILSFGTANSQTWTNLTTGDSYTGAVGGVGALQQLHDDPDTQDGHVLQLSPAGATMISTDLFDSDHDYARIDKAVEIDGNGCTIENDGWPTNTSAAIWFQPNAIETMKLSNITLCGFTHTNGSALKNTYFKDAKIIYEDVNVWNSANNSYAVWVEGDCDIINCSFSNPLQTSNTGGLSVRLWGDDTNTVNITNSQFDCNRKDGNGSAIEIVSTTTAGTHQLHYVNITGCSISNNNANYAALYCNTGKSSEITVTDTEFINNQGGNNEDGSPIYMSRASSPEQLLYLNNCLFQNNTGGTDNHLIRAAISTDKVIADGCTFIKGSGTANLIEINTGAMVNNSVLYGIGFNNDGGTASNNTEVGSVSTDLGDYFVQGVGPGTCLGGCAPPTGNAIGAQISAPECLIAGATLTSTMAGDWFYQQPGGPVVALDAASTTATIPADLSGYTTFWQEVATGSDPVFAATIAAGPDINVAPDNDCFGSIAGTIFQDGDATPGSANGGADAGEGLMGVVIHLLDNAGMPILDDLGNPITTTTDANGNYEFFNLPDGEYQIGITVPTGMVSSTFGDMGSTTNDSDVADQQTTTAGSMLITSTIIVDSQDTAASNDDSFAGTRNYVSVGAGFVIDAVALPVEWSEVRVQQKDCEVQISWKTEMEINNEYFEILASDDNRTFEAIARINGYGNTVTTQTYLFVDKLTSDRGQRYYKIMQVDYDGNYSYSATKAVNLKSCNATQEFKLYPTLTNDVVSIEYNGLDTNEASLVIYNTSGQKMKHIDLNHLIMNGKMNVSMKDFNAGLYWFKIGSSDGILETYRIIKL